MGVTPGRVRWLQPPKFEVGVANVLHPPQNFMKFITFDNVNFGQFVAKRPKLQIFYFSKGLLYFRLEQDGAESTCG
jgi:hypothetical protein